VNTKEKSKTIRAVRRQRQRMAMHPMKDEELLSEIMGWAFSMRGSTWGTPVALSALLLDSIEDAVAQLRYRLGE